MKSFRFQFVTAGMMDRKEKERATDEDRMIGDEPDGSQSMDLNVGEVFQNSEDVNSTESATGEKRVGNLKNFEEEPSKGNDRDCVIAIYFAKPLNHNSESRIEEKITEKVIDICNMRNLLILAQDRVKENMKELSHCMNILGKTSMEEEEVEKNNCMLPLSSSTSEKRNSETLEEVMSFERLSGSDLSLGMTSAVDRRLKVIEEKLSFVKEDHVAGRPPMKSSISVPSVGNCDMDGVRKEDSENSNPIAELRSPNKMDASLTKSTKHLQINVSELNSSFTDVIEESLNQQECVTRRGCSDVSLNLKAEDEVPVTNSNGQDKEDDPSSESLPNSEVNTSSKRSFPFGKSTEIIPVMKRYKVKSDDCSERIESRYMQSMEINCQNVCNILSPHRTLKVDLGFRCDSSEFQMEQRICSKNCSCLSKESIHHLKRIKTENESMNKENHGNVVSVKHSMVKREVEISRQVKHSLMGTFDEVSAEVCSQRNSVDECLTHEEGSGNHLQHPTKGYLAFKVQRHSARGFKKAILSKELTSNRLKTAVQRTEIEIKVEPVELEEEFQKSGMQIDLHSPKKEVEETKCNISVDEVEVLKVIKPVRVFLGYRCDLKEMLTKNKKLHLSKS
ncbi:hypothetical protein J437_LFUL011423 [Ladona fulva]|uniref:Uncharacterized protein n=1 Tax=Ladona fulva TaxID=123851 RepID=A0A8K0KSS0_LADFU|nr:hypothetical protein J437_LFUL011423 [Ladona fulva]